MSKPTVSVNGVAVRNLALRVGSRGPWTADILLTEEADLTGAVVLAIGDAELHGSVVSAQSFGLSTGAALVGGAGGWRKQLGAKGYHNDAGVKAELIAQDAAREAGETLTRFEPVRERVGSDYSRTLALASAALEWAAGNVPWYVDYDGLTHVGARPAGVIPSTAVEVLALDVSQGTAVLGVNDFAALKPGLTISDKRLSSDQVVRDIELFTHDGSALRATVWLSDDDSATSRLGAIVKSLVERVQPVRLHGCYRYRVVKMRADKRVDLQIVRSDSGAPDLQAIAQYPGVPGVSADLALGAEVLVQFVDGDAAQPLITHYAGPGGAGFVPTSIVIGGDTGLPAARQGDSVVVLLPPMSATGTMLTPTPTPFTAILQPLQPQVTGQITAGSGKVQVAT